MWKILLEAVLTVLVVYAIIEIIKNAYFHFFKKEPYISDNIFVVIKVKNKQDYIEGIIRSIIWQNLSAKRGGFVPSVLVVDMGSTDETIKIVERLCEDYSFIYMTDEDSYNTIKDKFLKNKEN